MKRLPYDSDDKYLNCEFNNKNENSALKIFFIAIIIIVTGIFCITKATTYYVKVGGNDALSGTSDANAWATLNKVYTTTLLPGDSVLFKAGHCWRATLSINESGTIGNYIYFGRYGTGKNPIIVGSTRASGWVASGTPNIWQHTGITEHSLDYYGGRLFFMIGDSIAYGDCKESMVLSELTEEFDYTVGSDGGNVHYMYSTVDPDIAYDSIEITTRETCVNFNFNNYLEFNGIDVKFAQRQGYFEGYPAPRGTTDLIFRNLYVGYTGMKSSGSAYGITAFYNNLLIENCTFSDNGRRAISVNTYTDSPTGRKIENIIIRNNTFKRGYHTTSLDLSTMNRTGDTVRGVYFYNNIIDDHEIDTTYPTSNMLFTQAGIGTSLMTDIYIVGNLWIMSTTNTILFENSKSHYVWNNTIIAMNPVRTANIWGTITLNGADTLDLRNNILYDNIGNNSIENSLIHVYDAPNVYFPYRDYNLYYSLYPKTDRCFTDVNISGSRTFWTTLQWNTFKSTFTGWEQNSPSPTNPDFVNYSNYNFRLSDSSVATRTGTVIPYLIVTDPIGVVDTVNKYDLDGNIRSRITPSIGAYEFVEPRVGRNDHIRAVYASHGTTSNVLDKDFDSYCQGYGTNEWLILALDDTLTIDNLAISYAMGDARTYYMAIQVSLDSTNWTTIVQDTTRGLNSHYETFMFDQVQASYIKIQGFGYNGGVYNLWGEVYIPPLNSTIESVIQKDTPFRILFIGNSFTAYGPVPLLFQDIVASHGWPSPHVEYTYISGESLATHRASATTASYFNKGNWDYVVLQDASRRTFSDTIQMYDDIQWFYDTIKATSPNAIVTLYSTWATLEPYLTNSTLFNTQPWNPTNFAAWETMQDGITHDYHRAAYLLSQNVEYSDKNDTMVVEVGEKWRQHFKSDTTWKLHMTDNHANDSGRYFNALSFYNGIYKTKTLGSEPFLVSDYAGEYFQSLLDGVEVVIEEDEEEPVLSIETDILMFFISNQLSSSINTSNHTVTLIMPFGTDVTSLSPTISLSDGATINPTSGVSRNFTTPQTYTVTAEDGITTQNWIVTINITEEVFHGKLKDNGSFVKYNGHFIVF